jgi:hypothetical protein
MNEFLRKDMMQFKEEVKDTFRHTDSRVYMHTSSHLEQVCREAQDQWNVGLKAIILAYENISHIIIHKGVFVDYSLVSMLLGGLRRDSTAKVVIKLDRDPREPLTVKDGQVRNAVVDKCATADAHAILDSEAALTALGVSPASIPAGVLLMQMPAVVNLLAISHDETQAPV